MVSLLNVQLVLIKKKNLHARVVYFILGTAPDYPCQSSSLSAKSASSLEDRCCTASPTKPFQVHMSPRGEFVIPTENTMLVEWCPSGLLGTHLLLRTWSPGTGWWSQLVLAALIVDSQVRVGNGNGCQDGNQGLKSRHTASPANSFCSGEKQLLAGRWGEHLLCHGVGRSSAAPIQTPDG